MSVVFSNVPHCPACEKPRCSHLKSCPTCKRTIFQFGPAVRGPAKVPNQAWVCLWCPAIICIWCYAEHTREHHAPAVVPSAEVAKAVVAPEGVGLVSTPSPSAE